MREKAGEPANAGCDHLLMIANGENLKTLVQDNTVGSLLKIIVVYKNLKVVIDIREDLTGMTFGRLTVNSFFGVAKNRAALWLCKCSCGNEKIVRAADLKRGKTQSCGCLQKERLAENRPKDYHKINVRHGETHTRLYNIYANMKQRCYNPNTPCYRWYGGKGITICDEWLNSYECFRDWATSNGYDESLSIDRIDPNKNYEPSNCRWIPLIDNIMRARVKTCNDYPKGVAGR